MSDEEEIDVPDIAGDGVKEPEGITDAFAYPVAFNFGFVGVGQAGGRLAQSFYDMGYRRVVAINTAHTDLAALKDEIPKLDLRYSGAGKDPELGARAVAGQEPAVYEHLMRYIGPDVDYILVCAGLGGGTGSGSTVPIIDICRRFMKEHEKPTERVGAIVTLPLAHEGSAQSRNSVRAFERICRLGVSPLMIIDNKRISEIYKVGAPEFYAKANSNVANLLHLFNRLAAQKSDLITFDAADFATLLDAGICVMGAAAIKEYDQPADIARAIQDQTAASVMADIDLKHGKKAACLFVGSTEVLNRIPMPYFGEGFAAMTRQLAPNSTVHSGVYKGKTKELRCYTIVADLPPPRARLRRLADDGFVAKDTDISAFLEEG